jgi:hypothetical protein
MLRRFGTPWEPAIGIPDPHLASDIHVDTEVPETYFRRPLSLQFPYAYEH